ncbi:putative bifunctional diguanylate cyclase/phosphodiesterase [Saccharospirillum mangrovi]|uniref:putative bifunctional diguanylate cyclase/phosphodiesterase n=1 Tax=Saccharospirillum mangrovi TaxID=2161747 RepID=UPI0013B3BD32|nr:EAL domain-containing protein [Saccharospirillum mangrovi]
MDTPRGAKRLHDSPLSLVQDAQDNPCPVLLVDADGTLLEANAGSWLVQHQWGVNPGDQLPEPWLSKALDALNSGETQEATLSSGMVSTALLFLPLPASRQISVIGIDITSRKQIEEKIELNARVFESALEGILIMDPDMRVIDVNPAYSEITGYAPGDVLGETATFHADMDETREFMASLSQSLLAKGSWQGELWSQRPDGSRYAQWLSITEVRSDDGNLSQYIAVLTDVTRQKEAEEQLFRMAHYDQLTGLSNRRLFDDRLAQAMSSADRSGECIGLMLIDLDGFKLVNDHLGHRSGDEMLRIVARRIEACVRESDTVARMGGDEFLLLLRHLDQLDSADLIAEQILARIAEPVTLEDQEFFLTASIGISDYRRGQSSEKLLRLLDSAMYAAKANGKNGYQRVSESLVEHLGERLTRQAKLRRAIEDGEIVNRYQGIVDLNSGRLTGLEVLARWDSPSEGLLGPGYFIDIAEESGLIRPLGEHVLRSACAQGAAWRRQGIAFGRLSVNVSAQQLRDTQFVQRVQNILKETGYPADGLDLELSEAVWIEGREDVIGHLHRLRELGITVSIDDFGTKYASLSYLKHLPVDRLKIDKSFVDDVAADPVTSAIVGSIMTMADAIGLAVVAEGVERREQLDQLAKHGCRFIQGYYFCRPETASVVPALAARDTMLVDPEGITPL